MEMPINSWVYDIETYSNCFTLVARRLNTKNDYKRIAVHDGGARDDKEELMEWLNTRPVLIGYNALAFDAQIIQYIFEKEGKFTAREIYDFKEDMWEKHKKDRFDLPYSQWELVHKCIDLFTINHYDQKKVSLKWLEFTTRRPKVRDLPIPHDKEVTKSNVTKLLAYNRIDVDNTYDFFYICEEMVKLRMELARTFKNKMITNMSDSAFGQYIFEHILVKEHGMSKKELKKGTKEKTIYGKDCLLDYIRFESPEFQQIHQTFKDRVYEDVLEKGVEGKQYKQMTMFNDMVFVFGSGGLHACYQAGEYTSDEEHMILSIDVRSYYPNIAIQNGFYPKHIGELFCKIYKSVYELRMKHPKGSALNYAYKIALNAVYGKSNSIYSIFYDLSYLLKITINGQLLLAMLAEQLSQYGRLLLVNTDGLEIKIARKDYEKVMETCAMWECATGLELEYDEYRKLAIRDVNNYMGVFANDKPKRKGMFTQYEDITEEGGKQHFYDRSPNATIIPKSLYNYYANGVSIEDTINGENNIHEFLYGIKVAGNYDYWLIKALENGGVDIQRTSERVLRYFISQDGSSIFKFWKDNRPNYIEAVNKGQLVLPAMDITSDSIEKAEYNVDRRYYISEAYKIIDLINTNTKDNAYIAYQKKLEKDAKL